MVSVADKLNNEQKETKILLHNRILYFAKKSFRLENSITITELRA